MTRGPEHSPTFQIRNLEFTKDQVAVAEDGVVVDLAVVLAIVGVGSGFVAIDGAVDVGGIRLVLVDVVVGVVDVAGEVGVSVKVFV
jgi:hypothetical protein